MLHPAFFEKPFAELPRQPVSFKVKPVAKISTNPCRMVKNRHGLTHG